MIMGLTNTIMDLTNTIKGVGSYKSKEIGNKIFEMKLENAERRFYTNLGKGCIYSEILVIYREYDNEHLCDLAKATVLFPCLKEFSFAKDEKVLEISKKIEIAIKVGKAKCKSSVAEDAYKFYVLEMKKYFEKRKDEYQEIFNDPLFSDKLFKQKVLNKELIHFIGTASAWLTPNEEKHFVVMPFCIPPTDLNKAKQYSDNELIKTIYSLCMPSPDFSMDLVNAKEMSASELEEEITKLNLDEYYICYTNPWSDCNFSVVESYKIKGSLIFWGLVMAAVDERFYENEMNMLSDMAYQLNFTEDMMNDWLKAVKYLLGGNMFSSDMPVEFKTAEANKFFKHK